MGMGNGHSSLGERGELVGRLRLTKCQSQTGQDLYSRRLEDPGRVRSREEPAIHISTTSNRREGKRKGEPERQRDVRLPKKYGRGRGRPKAKSMWVHSLY